MDEKGFLVTGQDFRGAASECGRAALPLETGIPCVFAIGDVRAGSTKRLAAAVGEGAAVVSQIHAALAFQTERHQGERRHHARSVAAVHSVNPTQ
jgi:thioredoxin reductase (NADPH)